MKCPKCFGATQVLETRDTRRRRRCLGCGQRFTTLEVMAEDVAAVDVAAARPAPRPKPKKPAQVERSAEVMQAKGRARGEARRKIEERRDARRWQKDDWYSCENDYLPEI